MANGMLAVSIDSDIRWIFVAPRASVTTKHNLLFIPFRSPDQAVFIRNVKENARPCIAKYLLFRINYRLKVMLSKPTTSTVKKRLP
jgi:hypothetical protein